MWSGTPAAAMARHTASSASTRWRSPWEAADEGSDDPRPPEHPLHFGDGLLDPTVGDEHDPTQSCRLVLAVLGEPVVVRPHERQVQRRVGRADDELRHPRGGEPDAGVDKVEVHLLEPRLGVVAAGSDLLEACPRPAVRDGKAGGGVEAEV